MRDRILIQSPAPTASARPPESTPRLFLMILPPPTSTLFPYTTLFRSGPIHHAAQRQRNALTLRQTQPGPVPGGGIDRKSTRLNPSHMSISYAVFCLKKKHHLPAVGHCHAGRFVAGSGAQLRYRGQPLA